MQTDSKTEQLEAMEQKAIEETIRHSIKAGESLERLEKNKDFKFIINEMFLKGGQDVLWENIKNYKIGLMRGNVRDKQLKENAEEMVIEMESQIKSRLDFEAFIQMIKGDHESALIERAEQKAEGESNE